MSNIHAKIISFLVSLCIYSAGYSQNNLIPNTSDCAATRLPFAFNIQKKWSASGVPGVAGVSNFSTPLAGDLDGDGKTEILVMSDDGDILIFDGATGARVGFMDVGYLVSNDGHTNPYLICDVEGDGKAEVLVINIYNSPPTSPKATLYTVTSNPGERPINLSTYKWRTELPADLRNGATSSGVIPAVADLDGDGEPEFIVSYYIIETNGTVAARMNYRGGLIDEASISNVADLDNDGLPEIMAGTDVYKYRNGMLTLWKSCPYNFPDGLGGREGNSMAGDLNLDGYVDLVFRDDTCKCPGTIVFWTPATNTVLHTMESFDGYSTYAIIGDIDGIVSPDGNKYPEICYNSSGNTFLAYSYDGTTWSQKFDMTTNEGTGVATFTYFDFNLDGVMEIVYRDEQVLHILDCRGTYPQTVFSMPATSLTATESPIVADVTGDGSADIIVTGSDSLFVFEGAASKWAACPNVWNQQLYSPLLINTDLTVPQFIKPHNLTFKLENGDSVQYYNGGPLQAPYISDKTYLPFNLSPDVYVIDGTVTIDSPTITIEVTFGNQGMATASASSPIQYYKNIINSGDIIGTGTLGVDLAPGQIHTISKTFTDLESMPSQFYVRILDDGANFPALGAYSDCNLTNNTKSFGTLELHKTVNSLNACIDGTSIFNIELTNNTLSSQTYSNIILTDSLGTDWDYISSSTVDGMLGEYYPATRKIQWTVSSLAPGATAHMIILAKSTVAAAIRNTVWVESVNGTALGKEVIEAYVIVNSAEAPAAATITPASPSICSSGGSVVLTASASGKTSYQWYRNYVEIPDATQQSYTATTPGDYAVTYFEDPCVSQMSSAVTVSVRDQATAEIINITGTTICYGSTAVLTANNTGGVTNPVYRWYSSQSTTSSLFTGSSYTTPALTETATYYVSVEGDNFCENTVNNRQPVTVTVNPFCAIDDHAAVTCETDTVEVLLNDIISLDCLSTLELSITGQPKHGEASLDETGTKIIYKYIGVKLAVHDTLTYEIKCGASVDTAKVYFTVSHVGSAFVDDVWYFGENSQGIRFVNSGGVYSATDASGESKVQSHENSLVVSSPYCDGQNIFYSSHDQIYNSLHEEMPHGHFAGHQSVADGLAACYIGGNQYLFFSVTNAYESGNRGLNAYIVDMTADNGRGDIIKSASIEGATASMSESIELIAGNTPNKYWLVYAYKNGVSSRHELRVREVDVSKSLNSGMIGGVLASPIQTSTTYVHHTYTLKASPQHDRLAIANSDDKTADVFDFDNTTGTISRPRTTPSQYPINGLAYGVEFSPDGKQLYAAGYTNTGGGIPLLCQYTIKQSELTFVDHIQYWTYPGPYIARGGGLKLGPDGRIYVMQTYVSHTGVVTDPDAVTPLSGRYQPNDLDFGVYVDSYAEQFSTGLTRPVMIVCNMNNPPETLPDSARLCVTPGSRTVKVDVLTNDSDFDADDEIYLTEAHFLNISDTILTTLAINATSDSVILTVKPGADIPAEGHVFDIIYGVKDNGLPASQCASGFLKVKAGLPPGYPDIRIRICPDVGSVNLSKYLDTVNDVKANSIHWTGTISGLISPAGTVSSSDLKSARVYTFTYELSDLCGLSPKRRVYLEKLDPDKMHPLKDTVVICYKYAEAVQINQLFGIEAKGKWTYYSYVADDVNQYVSKSISPEYGGAVVMNGKAIYESSIPTDSYHGLNNVKIVTFNYKADDDSCLHGKDYTVTIVLSEDIGN